MIYLDSSAIVKLLREEVESPALHAYLTVDDAPPLFSSQLAITEVRRALHAAGDPGAAEDVALREPPALVVPGHRILALPLTIDVVVAAGDLLPAERLRSLDALHLATAHLAGPDLTALVTYDARLASAAVRVGVPVEAPAPGAGDTAPGPDA